MVAVTWRDVTLHLSGSQQIRDGPELCILAQTLVVRGSSRGQTLSFRRLFDSLLLLQVSKTPIFCFAGGLSNLHSSSNCFKVIANSAYLFLDRSQRIGRGSSCIVRSSAIAAWLDSYDKESPSFVRA